MSIASDVYRELAIVGLAPDVPFVAADDKWREAINRGVGDADDAVESLREASRDNWLLTLQLEHADEQAEDWRKKYEAAMAATKEPVSA